MNSKFYKNKNYDTQLLTIYYTYISYYIINIHFIQKKYIYMYILLDTSVIDINSTRKT